MNLKQMVRQHLAKGYQKAYRRRRAQYLLDYPTWLQEREQGVTTEEMGTAGTELVLLSFEAEEPGSYGAHAEARFQAYFQQHPECVLVYGDEDLCQADGSFGDPWLKPDWSPDAYLCRDYLGGAVAVRREYYEQLDTQQRQQIGSCHDRLVELAGGYEKGCNRIGHLREVVYHRTTKWKLPEEGRPGQRTEAEGSSEHQLDKQAENSSAAHVADALVSVIIPSKDNPQVLFRCLETVQQTVQQPYEIILVDNGSSAENRARIAEWARENDTKAACQRIQYCYEPMEFNFSCMCNLGAKQAKGELLLFLNDDIEAVASGWLEQMARKAREPWAGAVGMKLLYPDGERIQHAGVVALPIGPVHKLQFLNDNECYYDGRNRGIWNAMAVTGACLMVHRTVFEEAGGFAEQLRVAFNDIDLCYTIHELGYHNVEINSYYLLHHESLSRGSDDSQEKQRRLLGERDLLNERHPFPAGGDPYYHPWLNNRRLDTRIRPAFTEGRLVVQEGTPQLLADPEKRLQRAREDACLRLTIEYAGTDWIQGYLVVLGSDNALFERKLLFRPMPSGEGMQSEQGSVYEMACGEQYRVDLEENMPDQTNVGLCGFHCTFATPLPKGEYQIGGWAKDRLSGLELIFWSHCTLLSYGDGRDQE